MPNILILLLLSFYCSIATSNEFHLPREDGSSITYYLNQTKNNSSPLLIIIQGSTCRSAFRHTKWYEELKKIVPDLSLLVVEKYAITKKIVSSSDCPTEYLKNNDIPQRLRDYSQVIYYLKHNFENWNGELYIFGGSEGADVTARLAPILNPKKIVVLAGGLGMTMANALPIAIRRHMKKQGVPDDIIEREISKYPDIFKSILDNPTWEKTWGGPTNTYKYWSTLLYYETWNDLLEYDGDILSIHGTKDVSSPVEASRKLVQIFNDANRNNLYYWEMKGLNHQMQDEEGNDHMEKIIAKAVKWLFF